jgi:uncharacterized protein YbjT (DUF2867 family)
LIDSTIEQIILPVRKLKSFGDSRVKEEIVDFSKLENYSSSFASDIVFCTLGTTINKAGSQEKFKEVDYEFVIKSARAAQESKAKKFILVTALGSDANSLVFYNRVKGEVERDVCLLSIPVIGIFRPSLLLGERSETRIGEKIGEIAASIFSFAFQGSIKKYKPIQAKAVAHAMIQFAKSNKQGIHIFESDEIEEQAKD